MTLPTSFNKISINTRCFKVLSSLERKKNLRKSSQSYKDMATLLVLYLIFGISQANGFNINAGRKTLLEKISNYALANLLTSFSLYFKFRVIH